METARILFTFRGHISHGVGMCVHDVSLHRAVFDGNGEVTSPAQVTSAMKEAVDAKRDRVLMLISRNGNERFVAVPFKRG